MERFSPQPSNRSITVAARCGAVLLTQSRARK
jgi:hypothetical protein